MHNDVNAQRIKFAGTLACMTTPENKARGARLQEAREDFPFHHASEAARWLGVKEPTYLAHENGSRGFTAKAGEKYATRFKVDYAWLMTGKGTKKPATVGAPKLESTSRIHTPTVRVVPNLRALDPTLDLREVQVIGQVQAGAFVQAIEWEIDDVERFSIPLPIPMGYRNFRVVAFVVIGPSMDEIYPHGSIVAGVKFLDVGRPPRTGERVVAFRKQHGLMEASVKEFRIDRDGKARLWPRSTHPEYQQPLELEDNGEEQEDHPEVVYLVIGSYRPEV
jgi:phage repressor protein C with HTH and peptisase S24 domain